MKIIPLNKHATKKFHEVYDGDVFKYDGTYYIKTSHNAVNLSNGNVVRFDDDTIILPVKCKLVIESEGEDEDY